jgi:sulfate-transporting ATPase/ATP-binding cassette subfamily B protein
MSDNANTSAIRALWLEICAIAKRTPAARTLLIQGILATIGDRLLTLLPWLLCAWWISQQLQSPLSPFDMTIALSLLTALLILRLVASWQGQLHSFLGAYLATTGYRQRLLAWLHRLPLGQLHQQRQGQLNALLTDDIKRFEDIFTHLLPELIASLCVPIISVLILSLFSPMLALAVLLPMPLALYALYKLQYGLLQQSQRKQQLQQNSAGVLLEFLGGILTLRIFNRSACWQQKLTEQFDQLRHASLGVEAWGGGAIQLYRLLLETSLVLLLLIAGWQQSQHLLQPEILLIALLLTPRLIEPLLDAGAWLAQLRTLSLAAQRTHRLFSQVAVTEGTQQLDIQNHNESGQTDHTIIDIEFHQLSFRYVTEEKATAGVQNVSCQIKAGQTVAIVGPSGAGKSTLLHLLARFYDPQAGHISLNSIDIRQLSLRHLYQQISFVQQNVQLFAGSIWENVRIGSPQASEEQVIAACQQAGCDEFIQQLAEGYDTQLGEDGCTLSGGQRQRLSIARALLRQAPILLLDEATSSVDSITQRSIQQTLQKLQGQRTLLMVAHRLHNITFADHILVMDNGNLVEQGNHQKLLAQHGLYTRLWQQQMPYNKF